MYLYEFRAFMHEICVGLLILHWKKNQNRLY